MDSDAVERWFTTHGRNPLVDACPSCGRAGVHKTELKFFARTWRNLRRKPLPCPDPFHSQG